MSVTACAEIVEKGDPDRFLAVMAAPVDLRPALWPLYAFNVEVARAPWVTEEPGIAEIRLQWWRDAVAEIASGGAVRRHEVVEPLAEVVRGAGLDCDLLDGIAAARRWDIYTEAFEDDAHFWEYLGATSGALMSLACGAAGAGGEGRDVGVAQGLANWLMAVPQLEARGRMPLVDGTFEGVKAVARAGLQRLERAEGPPHVLRAAWRARGILQQAARDPAAVGEGRLGGSEFARRFGLAWRSFRGKGV